jgi:hypothetical protein
MVVRMIGKGADVNAKNKVSLKLLKVYSDAIAYILWSDQCLLDLYLIYLASLKAGQTPIFFAAATTNIEIVRLLLDRGALVDEVCYRANRQFKLLRLPVNLYKTFPLFRALYRPCTLLQSKEM